MKYNNYFKIAISIFGRVSSLLITIIFVPLYLKYLGDEKYGLITLFVTLQSIISLLGLGFSKTISREFALDIKTNKDITNRYKLFRNIELIYFIIALFGVFVSCLCSNIIAERWLVSTALDHKIISRTISLMSVSIGVQLLTHTYIGCLYGLNKHEISNISQIIWSIIKNCISLLILIFSNGNIIYFYFFHILIDVIYFIVLRILTLKYSTLKKFRIWSLKDFYLVKHIMKFSFGMLMISIIYVINTQFDKAILSGSLSLENLGYYNTAFTFSTLPTVFTGGVATIAFTVFTGHFSNNNHESLKKSFLTYQKFTCGFSIVLCCFAAVFSKEILLFWTKSITLVEYISGTAFFLILGSMFLSLQQVPYEFLLSQKNVKTNTIMSILLLPCTLLLLPLLINNLGVIGAGVSWFIIMSLSTFSYLIYIFKFYFNIRTALINILKISILFILTLVVAILSKYIFLQFTNSSIVILCLGVLCGFIYLCIYGFLFCRNDLIELKNI